MWRVVLVAAFVSAASARGEEATSAIGSSLHDGASWPACPLERPLAVRAARWAHYRETFYAAYFCVSGPQGILPVLSPYDAFNAPVIPYLTEHSVTYVAPICFRSERSMPIAVTVDVYGNKTDVEFFCTPRRHYHKGTD